jgi:hypothetical protein
MQLAGLQVASLVALFVLLLASLKLAAGSLFWFVWYITKKKKKKKQLRTPIQPSIKPIDNQSQISKPIDNQSQISSFSSQNQANKKLQKQPINPKSQTTKHNKILYSYISKIEVLWKKT